MGAVGERGAGIVVGRRGLQVGRAAGGEGGGGGDDGGAVVGVARKGFDAGGDVHAVADDGVIEAAGGADVPGDDAGGVDADADAEGGFAFGGEFGVEGGEGFFHREGGGEGAVGVVALGYGSAEQRHDRVADVFIDDPAVRFEGEAHAVEIAVEEGDDRGGGEVFAEGGEAAEIGEEDGDLAFFAAEGGAVAEELRGDLGGDVFVEEVADAVAFVEAAGHLVEGFGEAAEFIVAVGCVANAVVAAGDALGVADEFDDGLAEAGGEAAAEVEGDGEAAEGDDEDDVAGGAGGAEFFVERVLEVEGGVAGVAGG